MKTFYRPVDDRFKILHHFAEWGDRWHWVIDADTSLWIPRGSVHGAGQHRGTDFECPVGTLVAAMADGMVVRARPESALDPRVGDGYHIIQIVNAVGFDAWWLKYSHLKTIYVSIGQRIRRGQPLGESGSSGQVDGPLLHVDLVDPRKQYHPIQWK